MFTVCNVIIIISYLTYFIGYAYVVELCSPPAACDSDIFHYITANIHNMYAIATSSIVSLTGHSCTVTITQPGNFIVRFHNFPKSNISQLIKVHYSYGSIMRDS